MIFGGVADLHFSGVIHGWCFAAVVVLLVVALAKVVHLKGALVDHLCKVFHVLHGCPYHKDRAKKADEKTHTHLHFII